MGGAPATVAPPALDSSLSTLAGGEASCRRRNATAAQLDHIHATRREAWY